jgi:gliding motility-associated-like protein
MHIAISDQGCRDTAFGEVYVQGVVRFFMPTAFSPNGDGINDILEPNITGVEVINFSIFNTWGEKIFQSTGAGWDGTYRDQAVPQGAYLYILTIRTESGEKKTLTGDVVLVR